MAAIIRLNEEGLTSAAGQLRQQGNELENLISQMDRVVHSLPESWEGAAALAYEQQFEDLKPGLVEARELVENIARQIEQTLRATQELDDNIAKQLHV